MLDFNTAEFDLSLIAFKGTVTCFVCKPTPQLPGSQRMRTRTKQQIKKHYMIERKRNTPFSLSKPNLLDGRFKNLRDGQGYDLVQMAITVWQFPLSLPMHF